MSSRSIFTTTRQFSSRAISRNLSLRLLSRKFSTGTENQVILLFEVARETLTKKIIQLRRTGLFDYHVQNGAKMVPFAGYEMPLSYEGVRDGWFTNTAG